MSFTIRAATLFSVLAILLLTITCSLTASVKAQNEIAWVYDYPTGMKTAAEKNKPVLIYIHEQWCSRCRNMDQNTWNNTEVVALSSSFVNINVLGTEQGKLYNYSKPPMVVLTDPQGKVLERYNAELSASEVTALQRKDSRKLRSLRDCESFKRPAPQRIPQLQAQQYRQSYGSAWF